MIAKRIDMREASKSRATRLAEYVMSEMDKAGRVADVFTVNCISDDALLAAKEIEICQARNTRAKDDKTYHLLLSSPIELTTLWDKQRELMRAASEAGKVTLPPFLCRSWNGTGAAEEVAARQGAGSQFPNSIENAREGKNAVTTASYRNP